MILRNLNISYGALQEGCALCLIGRKMTLFITGLCPNKCYYCPVSSDKMWKDKVYANERLVNSVEDAIEEVRNSGALGTAITGGEPLVVINRVIEYITALKKEFGKKHHIHLYSGFPNLKLENAERLFISGLDEIRFHIIATKGVEDSIQVASRFPWRVGVEIPALPELDYIEIAKRAKECGAQFMILDEYEINEENYFAAKIKHDQCQNALLAASENKITSILKELQKILPVHYCTVLSKYQIQYRNRLVASFYAKQYKKAELLDDGTAIRRSGNKTIRFLPVFNEPIYEVL